MKLKPTYKMQFKRRRLGKTNYKKRLSLLKSKKPRLVVRKSLNYIRAQIVEFDKAGDKTLAYVSSKDLKKLGWQFACDNLPAAYLTGLMVGKKAVEKGIKEAIVDMGLYSSTKGNKIYAVVAGARNGGLNVSINETIIPSEDRIKGLHIAKYLERFKILPEKFEEIKKRIGG